MDACLLTCPAAGMATSTAVAGGSWGLRAGAASWGDLWAPAARCQHAGAAAGAGVQPLPVHAAVAAQPEPVPDLERTGRVQAGAREQAAGWGKAKESPETLPRWGQAGRRCDAHIPSPVQLSPGAPREHGAAWSLRRSGSRARSRAAQARARCWGLGQVGPGAGKSFASPGAGAAALIWEGLGLVRGYRGSHEASSSLWGMDLTLAGTGANTDSEVLWLNGTGECYRIAQPPLGAEAQLPQHVCYNHQFSYI